MIYECDIVLPVNVTMPSVKPEVQLSPSSSFPPTMVNNARIRCSELIALLYLLHSVPKLPSSHQPDVVLSCKNEYALSFESEKELTNTLAFLASTSDDPDHIPAVCVRESSASANISVYVAINKKSVGDGAIVLQSVADGFRNIFTTLSGVDNGEPFLNVSNLRSNLSTSENRSKH